MWFKSREETPDEKNSKNIFLTTLWFSEFHLFRKWNCFSVIKYYSLLSLHNKNCENSISQRLGKWEAAIFMLSYVKQSLGYWDTVLHSITLLENHLHTSFNIVSVNNYTWMSAPLLSNVQLFVTPWTVACQASLSMEILQAKILEWVAISFSRGSSQTMGWACISCTAGKFFTAESPEGGNLIIKWMHIQPN